MSWLIWIFRMIGAKLLNPKCSWERCEIELVYEDSIAAGQVLDEPAFTCNDPDPRQFTYDA